MSSPGSPPFVTPENPDDPGRGPLIKGFTWTMTSLAIIVVIARVYVRSKARLLGAEDWTIVLAGVTHAPSIFRNWMSELIWSHADISIGLASLSHGRLSMGTWEA